jgi:oxygen-independent coproporphyrinogen-3 oxidase
MNGIYIHIPFCKKLCYYCDFHFTVSLKNKDKLIEAIIKELEIRKDYLGLRTEINTIYFGGGTPSVLTSTELEKILTAIHQRFIISNDAEITLEANPDDLNAEYLSSLGKLGINRLSIGIQSFFDEDLQWMNRRHNAEEALRSIKLSQDAGFNNMNIDLIYGIPGLTNKRWEQNLEQFLLLNVPHLSAYHLSIEPKTVLGHYKKQGKVTEISEEQSFEQYTMLTETMSANGYEHYEISNFCKNGYYSRHNTNYWKQGYYLGVGPSSHSFNGSSRQWNVAVNSDYIAALKNGASFYEIENLTKMEMFNDYLLTGLRTKWGINLDDIRTVFGDQYLRHIQKELKKSFGSGHVNVHGNNVCLTDKGLFISDKIISGLFYT